MFYRKHTSKVYSSGEKCINTEEYKRHLFYPQVKRSRSKGGLAGPDGTKSVFGQMCAKMSSFSPDSLLLPHRVWKVKFVGTFRLF